MTDYVLDTERLRLEPAREEHAGTTWSAIERSLPELRERMVWAAESSPQRVSEYLRRAEVGWDAWNNWDFVILLDEQSAGTIGLSRYDALYKSAVLGYWIRSDIAGQGIASEAGAVVVSFGFETLGLNRIELIAAIDNVASQRVAEKLGFWKEGTKRGAYVLDGKQIDTHLYGLLASDPRPGI